MSLTDVLCKKALPKEKQYRLSDVNGLSLRIDPNGKKYWSIRYTENGQRKSKALGLYPELSLKRAREIALDLRYKLKNTVEVEEEQPYFKEVAEDWFNNQKETWSSKHISNVRASLDELYLALAKKRINQIQAPEILQIIKKIEARGSLEIAKRTLSRCGMVMKYAIAHGYRYDNPAGDLVYALKNKRVKNLASLTASEMPEFLRKVRKYPSDAQTHHAIILIMLTGVRVSELLQAKWDEFDLEGRKWDIPEERMKNGLPHRVPLTDMIIAELQALRLTHNQDLLFPHRLNNKKPMRSESILAVIKRCGYAGRMTTHGFRSLFSTVLNESNLFNPDAIERQLAHVPQNRIRSAYNRAQYWEERVRLMEWYGEQVKEWMAQY
ncbi:MULTISPECIES: tyrosine-type recombinase/integrase [Acinetobacter]|uniref:tyrosine-type recombinase/integrase n=1 Tax=Acinetobacter TaxID=469 RepID=UPI00044ACAA9|nr:MULTISPECIES: tyrosine-type recombinase/integrase [Acinetobacter]EXE12704.1 phage integrase family protein [Acinetobacter sp. 983759]MCM1934646.1 tyrosine-type recombinase/integrase [Acinetobacter radioresistens]MCM1952067.1 tyrosine-type recombinase/integrase [Acinetobacter radioresistens]MCU4310424.1 tyrosine-type recombinase/integrase [Acinetobacter radioresistens]MCU4568315.1 tyrosine-type recombinase/integrase [Acinetobacter radioresistens]